jgi:hypothetical protein
MIHLGIKLSLEVYNSTNNLIGLTQGAPTYTILEPGQSSTFEILSDVGRLNGFDHYIIKTGYYASFSSLKFGFSLRFSLIVPQLVLK